MLLVSSIMPYFLRLEPQLKYLCEFNENSSQFLNFFPFSSDEYFYTFEIYIYLSNIKILNLFVQFVDIFFFAQSCSFERKVCLSYQFLPLDCIDSFYFEIEVNVEDFPLFRLHRWCFSKMQWNTSHGQPGCLGSPGVTCCW